MRNPHPPPRDNRHLSRTDAGRTGGSRGPRANSVHSRSERPDPGDNPGGTGAPRHRPGGSSDHSRVNAPIPGITAPAPAAAAVPASVPGVPSAKVDLPQLPYLPLQVPQQLSLPADLPALASGVIPAAPIAPTPPAPGAPALPPGPPSLLAALP